MPPAARTRARQPRMPIEVRRQQVLDVALHLIAEQGYEAVTMEAVAREADLAKPVVYNAYPGRAALLQALLEREEQRALRTLADAMPPQPVDGAPAPALRSWLRTLAEAIAADPAPWRLMLVGPEQTPREVRERVRRGRDLALQQVRVLTRPLLAGEPGLRDLDEELAAHAMLAVCEHLAGLMVAEPERYPPERLVGFADAVLRAIGR